MSETNDQGIDSISHQLTNMKTVRKHQKSQITRLLNMCMKSGVHLEEISAYNDRAQEIFKNYEIIQNEIDVILQDENEQEIQQQYRTDIEDSVLKIKTMYYKILNETTVRQNQGGIQNQSYVQENNQLSQVLEVLVQQQTQMSTLMERFTNNIQIGNTSTPQSNIVPQSEDDANTSHHELKLPRVQLPDFDGNLLDWVRFKELFEAFIHNRINLPNVEKLEFLHTKLKGEALLVIKHLKPMNSNYEVAWELLKKRYDNTEKIKNAYMELIFNLADMKTSSLSEIKRVYNSINEGYNALKAMDTTVDQWSSVLLYTIEKKLDNSTAILWFREKTKSEISTFAAFLTFLENRITELECMQSIHHCSSTTKEQHTRKQCRTFTATIQDCIVCTKQHPLYFCDEFKKLDVTKRRDLVQKHNLCFNCLRANHKVTECRMQSTCKKCNKKHNTLLHLMTPFTPTTTPTTTQHYNAQQVTANQYVSSQSSTNDQPTTCTNNNTNQTLSFITSNKSQQNKHKYVILPTAIIGIRDKNDMIHHCRALLDSGSQGTLITESCVQRLNLKRQFDNTTIFGLGAENGTHTRGKVTLNICSISENSKQITTNALCLSKLTQVLPTISINDEKFNYFKNLKLADPNYNKPSAIDIILGADVFVQCCLSNKVVHPSGSPTALSTIFGWVFMGQVHSNEDRNIYIHYASTNLDQELQRFWEMENVSPNIQHLSYEDQQAEQYYANTTQRNQDGRYIVRLPLKNGMIDIGQSKHNAIKRLHAMENKFKINSEIESKYKEFMEEYVKLSHMEIIKENLNDTICYLPHHAILKPTSTTSKLRVVFDASNKTSNGKSLNDNLLTGPKIQNDIFDMMINFRKFAIACVGDIEKMYRQVLVHDDDKLMQCIVWRNKPDDEIKTYCLNTITYGTAAAPFLAVRTLHEIANAHSESHPEISNIIKNQFYVDDLMYCTENIQEAIHNTQQLRTILSQAGFHIRKWTSNAPEFLSSIPITDRAAYFDAQLQSSNTLTLGLLWDTKGDIFKYSINANSSPQIISKRSVLSDIAKLYDPMGWIAPIVINMKIFIQKLWLVGLNWDDCLPDRLLNHWKKLRNNINEINKIQVKRWFQYTKQCCIELHGFSDASERAYAASIYIKVKNEHGEVFTQLVAAKTRVTPIKQISLPRLELCAAHLLVKLMSKVRNNFVNTNIVMHGWTDSMVVLAWISDHPCKWKTFIANRTSYIIELIPPKNWHHIQSKNNPADVASRGTTPTALISDNLWWHGPKELKADQYGTRDFTLSDNIDLEARKVIILNTTTHDSIINENSNFTKLLRTVAWIKRFLHNCKNRQTKINGWLTIEELKQAEYLLVKIANEIKIISTGKQLPAKNTLTSLAPIIDEYGLLRVGGRICNAHIPFNQKHPIILHHQHHLTELLVRYYHLKHLHAGKRLLFYIIHLKFWIPSAQKIIKRCIYKCTTCVRFRGQYFQQQMGNLPATRLVPAPTFSNVGIDFAGPVQVISWKGRGNKIYKSWIAIFVCMVTKAIHIELVSELSTPAFIASLRRFVARRGLPNNIYCDNGTNFRGAEHHLKELYKLLNSEPCQEQVMKYSTEQQIKWHFSPPTAPHFGGLWEAGVKSIKYHLRRILKNAHPTFEEMQTVLCQIESCLNSRPICIKNEGDTDALTPAHFILLRPLMSLPDENYEKTKENHLNRWQYIQRLVQQFWRKWSQEYFHQLQQRTKWQKKSNNICENGIVLIRDDQLAPSNWLIGKVTKIHLGTDNLARVATIKTATGEFKRPVVKLCPLFPTS